MGTPADSPPVDLDELLMRKVPAHAQPKPPLQFNPNRSAESPLGVTFHAFKPTGEDDDGLSVSRMRSDQHPDFLDIDSFAARACQDKPPEKFYYVTVLSAETLMDPAGLAFTLVPDAVDGDAGHTLIRELHAKLDKPTRQSLTLTLARECCLRVVGPFNCNGKVADRWIDESVWLNVNGMDPV